MTPEITVVICTFNPRPDYLARVLDSLRTQTLPTERWELILVDNASTPPLAPDRAVPGHPQGRVIVEPKPGLAWARKCGHTHARGSLLVYLDDDTVAAPEFLARAVRHFTADPDLGCAGPGRIIPEFEVEPDPAERRHLHMLALLDLAGDRRSTAFDVIPPGAGLVCRRSLLDPYFHLLSHDARRSAFGTKGGTLFRGEDSDMVMTVLSKGAASAQFIDLELRHLIPGFRVTPEYLLRLTRANGASSLLLKWAWHNPAAAPRPLLRRTLDLARLLLLPRESRRYALAFWQGEHEARTLMRRLAREPRS